MSVSSILQSRVSVRAYTPQSVPMETLQRILDIARWAPSGSNLQPWKVIAVTGAARSAVCELARRALAVNPAGEEGDFPVYPARLAAPFMDRRARVAMQRYDALGIQREDAAGRAAAVARNYEFWGAPVGLFFVTDRTLAHSQWAHLGMFIHSVVLVSTEMGLGSCVQEAWAKVRESLHQHFELPREALIYCGMALGHPDRTATINTVRSTRESVEDFATFFS